jgi:hypothetical protein
LFIPTHLIAAVAAALTSPPVKPTEAPKPVEPYHASSMYFYSEPQLVELKRENLTGLRMTLSRDKRTLRDFFEKKRDQQK